MVRMVRIVPHLRNQNTLMNAITLELSSTMMELMTG